MAKIRLNTQALAGSLTNTEVASNAGIDYSKLDLTGAIVNADIASTAAINYTALNLTGSVGTADLNFTIPTDSGDVWSIGSTPAGDVDGTNTVYQLASTPSGYKVLPFLNGVRLQRVGDATDNTEMDKFFMTATSSTDVTLGAAPETGDIVLADYVTG